MAKLENQPKEIPTSPDKPEVKPPEEVPTKTWPEKNPEIIPGKEPDWVKPPYEIPPPSESKF